MRIGTRYAAYANAINYERTCARSTFAKPERNTHAHMFNTAFDVSSHGYEIRDTSHSNVIILSHVVRPAPPVDDTTEPTTTYVTHVRTYVIMSTYTLESFVIFRSDAKR